MEYLKKWPKHWIPQPLKYKNRRLLGKEKEGNSMPSKIKYVASV